MLHNISRSKADQTMKFDKLMDCNERIIFIKKYTQDVVEKLVLDPFLKNKIELIFGSIV